MKVIVSYACDLKDIPSTVVELLQNLKENHLPGITIDIQDAILNSNDNKIAEALESMDAARIGLAKLDNRLMDYMSILAGYSKTNADIHLGTQPNPPQEESNNNVDIEEQKTND
ncbi:MAG: hypothetical protein CMB80_01470 [Flammeovirgaceae bacterium]|nr:hypothetical protein [Flammeovirgaceae bacterium]|tara:strand:+ start:691 stop:1032 length:342 start_codon:yes stop_codon:yes gene_type:complete